MVLRFFLLAGIFLFASCTAMGERNSPYDPESPNYIGNQLSSSQSIEPVPSSSSAGGATLSSSSSKPSSSSSVVPVVPSSSSVLVQTEVIHGEPVIYEGETYETVVIGTQTWMARNLNYNASGSMCNDCATYGRLYDWATAMKLDASCNSRTCALQVGAKHQGICPSGWHIPSAAEWETLTNFVGSNAGTKLKATNGWNTSGNYIAGKDNYGFSALPGGRGNFDGSFSDVGNFGRWWTASEDSSSPSAYIRSMSYTTESANGSSLGKGYSFSVRCVKD